MRWNEREIHFCWGTIQKHLKFLFAIVSENICVQLIVRLIVVPLLFKSDDVLLYCYYSIYTFTIFQLIPSKH